MKATPAQQQALIQMLSRIYEEIRQHELFWGLVSGSGDMRPRIDAFHDAVQALSEGAQRTGRLSVERLAYDLGMLRYLQDHPLSLPNGAALSPGVAVIPRPVNAAGERPGPDVKHTLAELYRNYAVLFAALLAEAADRDYRSRIDENDDKVSDLAQIAHVAAAQGGTVDLPGLVAASGLPPELARKVLAPSKNAKSSKRMEANEAVRRLKDAGKSVDAETAIVERAHLTYATSQLAIYEEASAVIKKMAVKGFNIVGAFVESAVQDAQRGRRER